MTAPTLRLGRADVRAAAERIADHIRPTPLLPCLPGLRLKAEHQQRGGSFKFRGAANALLGTPATAVVTGSSGNHGIAVATLGARLGIPVTVVMAEGASQAKAAKIRNLGATVIAVPGEWPLASTTPATWPPAPARSCCPPPTTPWWSRARAR